MLYQNYIRQVLGIMVKEHLNFDDILNFVCSDSKMFAKDTKNYFSYIQHFSECDKCRKIKNDLCKIKLDLESAIQFLKNDEIVKLKAKIAYSLERLQIPHNKYNNIILAVKGTISNKTDNSKFYLEQENQPLLSKNFDYVTIDDEGITKKYLNMIADDKFNKITLDAGNISVSLSDDGKATHSVLLIPDNLSKEPIIHKLKKEKDEWKADCVCPEDDYDIVIF